MRAERQSWCSHSDRSAATGKDPGRHHARAKSRGCLGEILALFAKTKGTVGLMIDAAVRDVDELAEVGLPVWARWITSTGAIKSDPGRHDVKVSVGAQTISPGDLLVLDGDGLVRVPPESEKYTLDASKTRVVQEERMMTKLAAGESTLDLMNLRSLVDRGS